ncbi:hypothetical protein H5232_22310 [Pseudoalteromonas sp. SG41-5]|uniref:hypothetical protein n=1 Tax=Pseudoalteromonas sp. SG41-5 TaxID=2760975 RepID=UPI001600A225|nr:hypothetical protein [Pseudoalteromonas sp. SG41-5]MBB1471142.1 hypothetical protein [Pseudoalteromonas sp. SG41-5]
MASNVILKAELKSNGKYQLDMIIPPNKEPVSQTKAIFESIENAHAFGIAAMKQVWPDINITIEKVE